LILTVTLLGSFNLYCRTIYFLEENRLWFLYHGMFVFQEHNMSIFQCKAFYVTLSWVGGRWSTWYNSWIL